LPQRLEAVTGLTKLAGPDAADAIVHLLADEQLPADLVLAALQGVAGLKIESALPAVRRLLAGDEAEIRAQAIETLGQVRGAAAADDVIHALADTDPDVRRAAVRTAGQLELRATLGQLMALVADRQVRDEAILALAAMPDRQALPIYLDGLLHKNPTVRVGARAALTALRGSIGRDIVDRYKRGELPVAVRAELQPIFNAPKPITTWHIAGPWPRNDPPQFDPTSIPNLNEPLVIAGQPMAWHKTVTSKPGGEVVVNGHLRESTDVCALAYATLDCAADYTTVMQLGCDDEAVVWVNGKQVAERLGNHSWNPSELQTQIALKKGTNHVWLRSGNDGGGWKFSLAFGTQDPEFQFLYEDVPAQLDAQAYREFALSHTGSPQRGREIFADLKGVGCIKCHAVGGVGAKIGPDLAGIGTRYPRAELIRSVLEPSNRVAAGYQVTTIVTDAGKVYSGIIKSDGQDMVELVDVEGRVTSISTGTIDERNPSNLSLMPSGLKDGLTPENFADVIAYLESLK
jgi:putative heme-binding domain-containing protein